MKKRWKDEIDEKAGIITIINEPTLIEDLDGLIAKYTDKLAIKNIQGIKVDVRRIKDRRYFVKKAHQILNNPNPPMDSDSIQWRVLLVQCLKNILNTQFRNTRDLNRKIGDYLNDYKIRKGSAGERIKKARKKMGWTQKQAAKELGFKSHVTFVNYEKDRRYPPDKVFRWLDRLGV